MIYKWKHSVDGGRRALSFLVKSCVLVWKIKFIKTQSKLSKRWNSWWKREQTWRKDLWKTWELQELFQLKEKKKKWDENAEEVSQERLKRLIWAYPGKIAELQDRENLIISGGKRKVVTRAKWSDWLWISAVSEMVNYLEKRTKT